MEQKIDKNNITNKRNTPICFLSHITASQLRGELGERRRHSMFHDDEADQLVTDWEILSKEKRVMYLRNAAEEMSYNLWIEMYPEEGDGYTEAEWRAEYDRRSNKYNYSHVYYLLRKQ